MQYSFLLLFELINPFVLLLLSGGVIGYLHSDLIQHMIKMWI